MSASPSWGRARDVAWSQAQRGVLEDLERQYLRLKEDRAAAEAALQAERALVAGLQAELAAARQAAAQEAQAQHDVAVARQAAAADREAQTLLQERLDRLQRESDQLREEISRLHQSNASLQEQLSTQEVASRLQESQAIPLLHETHRLRTELDATQAHASWLEQELADRQKLVSRLRQEHSDHVLQLQLQLDVTAGEKQAAVARHTELSRIEERLQEKVAVLSRDLLELKQERAQRQEEHETELASERRLIDLQKRQLEQWSSRCSSLENQIQALQQAAEQAVVMVDQEKQDLRKELEAKYQALLEAQARDLQKQTVAPRLAGVARGLLLMDAASQSAGGRQDGGGSTEDDGDVAMNDDEEPLGLTEMYTRYHETKSALQKERKQKEHCQSLLFDLQKEIEAMAPGLVRQREEYDQAMDRLKDFQERLQNSLEERDHFRAEAQEARQEVTSLLKSIKSHKKESELLAQHVQALLRKEADGTEDPSFPMNVAQVQEQNQRLLAERIEFQEKVNELEGRLKTDVLRTKLDATEREVKELKFERTKQEEIVEQLVQQRDLYRALVFRDDKLLGSVTDEQSMIHQISQQSERATRLEQKSQELERSLAEARGEIDALKREKDDLSERFERAETYSKSLMDTLGQHERDLLSARSTIARAESNAQYHKEKCERLEDSLQRARDEMSHVVNSNNQLQRINSELHQAVSQANGQSSTYESEKNQAEMKIRLIEAQLQTVRASESRLAKENSQLQAELAQHGSMVDNLRRIETRLAAKSEGEVSNAIEEAERLRAQLEKEQAQHASVVEALNGRISALEIRLNDVDAIRAKSQDELVSVKASLLECQNEVKTLSAKNSELSVQLRSAKRKLGEVGDDDETKLELTLRNRIKVLTDELETVKSEMDSLKKQAEHYQKIAKDGDVALAEATAAAIKLKEEYETEKMALKQKMEALQQDTIAKQQIVAELASDLANQRSDREKAEATLQSEIAALKTEIQNNKDDTEAAKAAAAAMKLDVENLRDERDRAMDNYERELNVHSESRTALRQARELADKEARKRQSIEENLDGLKLEFDQQRELWNQEKAALQESTEALGKTLAFAREQNTLLHSQIESLNSMVDKRFTSTDDSMELSNASVEEMRKSLAELREIVKIVRSENEILQTEVDNSKRSIEREKAAASVVKRSLDEARAELSQLQKVERDSDSSATAKTLIEKVASMESQAALLKDSNNLLRENVDKLQQSLAATQSELDLARKALQPDENVKHELENKIVALVAENEGLRRELDDWKNRVKSIISKFNQIDPVEHSELKSKVEELTKENESLSAWKRATEEENIRIRTIATKLKEKNQGLQKDIQNLSTQLATASNSTAASELSEAVKERDELKAKIIVLQKEVASQKLETAGLTTQTENLRKRLRQLIAEKQETANTEKTLKARIDSLESQLEIEKNRQPEILDDKPVAIPPPKEAPKEQGEELSTVPSVPAEGFKFGPSERPKSDDVSKPTEPAVPLADQPNRASSVTATVPETSTQPSLLPVEASAPVAASDAASSSLRPSAPSFVPKQPTVSESQHPPTPPSIKKEVSIKEKLLEKKRKLLELQEARSRKAAMEKGVSEDSNSGVDKDVASPSMSSDHDVKRRKMDDKDNQDAAPTESEGLSSSETLQTGEGQDSTEQQTEDKDVPQAEAAKESEPPVESEAAVEADTKNEGSIIAEPASHVEDDGVDEAKTVTKDSNDTVTTGDKVDADVPATAGDVLEVHDSDSEEAGDMVHDDEEEEEQDQDDSQSIEVESIGEKPADTTAAPVTQNLFGGFGSGTAAPVFGQPSLGFGNATAAASSSSSSGAFLDIKPPASSSVAPVFSFGSSPSFTLPIPSQAPAAPSPFGAFGTGVSPSFSFGQSSAAFAPKPLFGDPAPATDVMEDEQEEDKMEDNEGDMEAEM